MSQLHHWPEDLSDYNHPDLQKFAYHHEMHKQQNFVIFSSIFDMIISYKLLLVLKRPLLVLWEVNSWTQPISFLGDRTANLTSTIIFEISKKTIQCMIYYKKHYLKLRIQIKICSDMSYDSCTILISYNHVFILLYNFI